MTGVFEYPGLIILRYAPPWPQTKVYARFFFYVILETITVIVCCKETHDRIRRIRKENQTMKSMKKLLAVFLAALLVLPSVFVYAGETESSAPAAEEAGLEGYEEGGAYDQNGPSEMTVDTTLNVDVAAVKNILKMFGMPAFRINRILPFLELASDLEVKTVIADGGVQVDIIIDDQIAISSAGEATENGIIVGSTLFPKHIVTVSPEAIMEMMKQQGMASMPADSIESEGAEADEAGSEDSGEVAAEDEAASEDSGEDAEAENALTVYFERMMESFTSNAVPGEPETGEYEFEGFTFDTKTPINVDAKAMAADECEIVNEMLDDAAVLEMVNPFIPLLQAYGLSIDDIKKINEDFMADEHIPNVTSDIYSNSEDEELIYYVNEATHDGQEDPYQHSTLLFEDSSHAHFSMSVPEAQLAADVKFDGNTMDASFDIGGMYVGFKVTAGEEDDPTTTVELYFLDTSKPLASATITILPEGERTLSLDLEGKKVTALEEAFTNIFVLEDLASEIVSNWMNTVMSIISKKIPGIDDILGSIFGDQTSKSRKIIS